MTDPRYAHLQHIWRQLADDLTGVADSALLNFLNNLCKLFEGVDCQWYAGRRDVTPSDVFSLEIFAGWWIVDILKIKPATGSHEVIQKLFFELIKKHGHDPLTMHAIKNAGKTRVHLRQDSVNDETWDQHWKYRHFLEPIYGVKERMHAIYTLNDDSEIYILIDRAPDQPVFNEDDRALAYIAISGAVQLHRRLFFERGLLPPANKILAPRQKETFQLLLTDLSEKEIAQKLGVGTATAHQYIAGLYTIFRVRGRSGFLSLCRQY